MKFNLFGLFRKTPRSVTQITETFSTVVEELSTRIDYDEQKIVEDREKIAKLQSDIASSENSKNSAIAVRARIKDLLGIK